MTEDEHASERVTSVHSRTAGFSVVIPTRKRQRPLRCCLAALSASEYPRDRFEVIVVDDGGDSRLDEVVVDFQDRLAVRLVTKAHAGPAAARNAGAAAASFEYLAFTDDDCEPVPSWLATLAACFACEPAAMIGGRVVDVVSDSPFAGASQALISYLYEYFNRDGPRFFCSNNMAVPRRGFLEAGGFDTGFPLAGGEDRDLCDRWRFAGRPMTYRDDAVVLHTQDLDLRRFVNQHFRYGRAAVHYHKLFAARRSQAVAVEPLRFYVNLVRYPFRDLPLRPALVRSGLLVLSQAANAAGFFYERMRR
jgi:glycosyltransferase involved in cell wall biosynthesis